MHVPRYLSYNFGFRIAKNSSANRKHVFFFFKIILKLHHVLFYLPTSLSGPFYCEYRRRNNNLMKNCPVPPYGRYSKHCHTDRIYYCIIIIIYICISQQTPSSSGRNNIDTQVYNIR